MNLRDRFELYGLGPQVHPFEAEGVDLTDLPRLGERALREDYGLGSPELLHRFHLLVSELPLGDDANAILARRAAEGAPSLSASVSPEGPSLDVWLSPAPPTPVQLKPGPWTSRRVFWLALVLAFTCLYATNHHDPTPPPPSPPVLTNRQTFVLPRGQSVVPRQVVYEGHREKNKRVLDVN